MTLQPKDAYTVRRARTLRAGDTTETGQTLAVTFKHRRLKTDAGGYYAVGTRAIYNYLRAVWHRLKALGMHDEAEDVAQAFTNANGQHAWLA